MSKLIYHVIESELIFKTNQKLPFNLLSLRYLCIIDMIVLVNLMITVKLVNDTLVSLSSNPWLCP